MKKVGKSWDLIDTELDLALRQIEKSCIEGLEGILSILKSKHNQKKRLKNYLETLLILSS